MSVTTPSSLLTAGIAMMGDHDRAATAAVNALSVPYFTADGPDDRRSPELHPVFRAAPRVPASLQLHFWKPPFHPRKRLGTLYKSLA